jgi:hypothetical protein
MVGASLREITVSDSANRRILTAAVLFALCGPVLAGAPRPDDYVARAMEFLRSLFPAMGGTDAIISDQRALGRELYPDAINPLSIKLTHRSGPDPLGAYFTFDFKTHDLRDVLISGPVVTDRVRKFEQEVDGHPEWSEDQILARLKAAGAKFGPNDREEFLRTLPLKKLEPLVGHLEVTGDVFSVRSASIDGDPPVAAIAWTVTAKWHSADGKLEGDRILLFEPFEGTLWSYSMSSSPRPTGSRR